MQSDNIDNEDEKPLDPEMEKVRRKMVRLLAISLGIMFVGIAAVLIGVFYKIRTDSAEPESQVSTSEIPSAGEISKELEVVLPLGFKVQEFELDGGRIAVRGSDKEGLEHILVIDLVSGTILSDILLRN